MKKARRLILFSLLAAGALLAVAAVSAPFVVDAEALKRAAEVQLERIVGRPISLGDVSFGLWSGAKLRADGIRIEAPAAESGEGAVTFTAERAVIRLALLSLLRGEVDVRSARIRNGVVRQGDRVLVDGLDARGKLRVSVGGGADISAEMAGCVRALGGGPVGRGTVRARRLADRVTFDTLALTIGPAVVEATGELSGIDGEDGSLFLDGQGRIEQTGIDGTIRISGGMDDPRVRFDLTSPMLDLDRLGPWIGWTCGGADEAAGREEQPVAPPSSDAAPEIARATPPVTGGTPEPVSLLETARVEGTLRADAARVCGLDLTNVAVDATLEGGVLRIEPVRFATYGGDGEGTLVADLKAPALPFSLEGRAEKVDAGALLGAIDPSLAGMLKGTGRLSLRTTGSAAAPDLARALSGDARLDVSGGELTGVDIVEEVTRILEIAGIDASGGKGTTFERLSGTLDLRDGRARTPDLQLRSPHLNLDGAGTIGLDGSLEIEMLASFSPELSREMVRRLSQLRYRVGDDGRVTIPLRLEGNAAEPRVEVDVDRVLREGVEQGLKKKGRGLLRKLFGKERD